MPGTLAAIPNPRAFERVASATARATRDTILRRETQLRFGKFAVGVEVLPERIVAVLTDHAGDRFAKRKWDLENVEPESVAGTIGEVARELASTELGLDLPNGNVVIGIQIGAPVDSRTGTVLAYRNPRDEPAHGSRLIWPEPVPLADYVQEETGCRAVVENDAAAYAIYELKWGGHDASSFAVVLIRDGVGAALVLQESVLPCPLELGHLNVTPALVAGEVVDGERRECLCGKVGCIESVAGRRAMHAVATKRKVLEASIDLETLATWTDPQVLMVFREAGAAVAQGIATLLTLFGVELVVIHHDKVLNPGTLAADAFHEGLSTFRDYTFEPYRGSRLETRTLKETVGAHGGALVALNRLSFVPLV
jgi:predicted NBD/HSP70 family sugar kinase